MRWALVLLLFAQEADVVQVIDRERMTAQGQLPWVGMVTIIARHADGSPARGAIILNPFNGTYEEDPMVCTALDKHGHTGSVSFTMPTERQEIVVH